MEGDSDLRNLDMVLLDKARTEGWAHMSKVFVSAGKSRVALSEEGRAWETTMATTLEFLGAYRKLMIDHLISRYVAKMQASERARAAYAEFLGGATFASVIVATALGSTNTTSDYDLTLCGPGVPCILHYVTRAFRALADTTMAFAFDSNFYTGPDILVRRGDERYAKAGVTMFFPNGEAGAFNVAVPVPDAHVFRSEREYILRKREPHAPESTAQIAEKYEKLVKVSRRLDRIAYRNGALTKHRLFDAMFRTKLVSVEAYHGVSTVLVVVYGMQAKMMGALRPLLTEQNFENACLENIFDFVAHWTQYTGAVPTRAREADVAMFVKLSKYVQRVLVCLDEIARLRSDDRVRSMLALKPQIDRIVESRARGTTDERVDLAAYGIPATGALALDDGDGDGRGLVHDAYRYLTARAGRRPRPPPG